MTFAPLHTNTGSYALEPEQTFAVEFHIYGSLVAGRRTIVKRERDFSRSFLVSDPIPELLSISSNISSVLWNFYSSKDERRLTLEDNPHFYEELPTSRDAYEDSFSMLPIESIADCLCKKIRRGIDDCIRIYVLTDNLGQGGRVFLKTARKTRAFGNVCAPKNALIFKGPWPFYHHSHLLTSSQTPKESLREKASSVRKSKTHPYGVLPNLRPPLNRRVPLLRVANRRP